MLVDELSGRVFISFIFISVIVLVRRLVAPLVVFVLVRLLRAMYSPSA